VRARAASGRRSRTLDDEHRAAERVTRTEHALAARNREGVVLASDDDGV
jgi:hypothetical protein